MPVNLNTIDSKTKNATDPSNIRTKKYFDKQLTGMGTSAKGYFNKENQTLADNDQHTSDILLHVKELPFGSHPSRSLGSSGFKTSLFRSCICFRLRNLSTSYWKRHCWLRRHSQIPKDVMSTPKTSQVTRTTSITTTSSNLSKKPFRSQTAVQRLKLKTHVLLCLIQTS